jgi:hypothetical protein
MMLPSWTSTAPTGVSLVFSACRAKLSASLIIVKSRSDQWGLSVFENVGTTGGNGSYFLSFRSSGKRYRRAQKSLGDMRF